MTKTIKIAYWCSTIILSLIMVYSAWMYLTDTTQIQSIFTTYGYPSYLVIPLAIAKIIGVIVIIWRPIKWLTHWAYAGFFFDLSLAVAGHYMAHDGSWLFPLIGIVLVFISMISAHRVRT